MRVCGLWDASLISHSQVNTSTALWSPQRDLPKSFLPTHSQLWFWPHFWENNLFYFPSRFLFSHPVQRGSNYKDKLMMQLACRFLLRKSQILCEVFKALHVWLPESSLAWTMSFKPADLLAFPWIPQVYGGSLSAQPLCYRRVPMLPLTCSLFSEAYLIREANISTCGAHHHLHSNSESTIYYL